MVLLLLVSILHWEMAYSVRIVLRKYKPNSMGYHILQLCVTKNSCRKRISLKLYVDMVYLTTDHIQRLADGNYIVYKRNKIKHQKNATAIRIHITPEIQGVIEQLQSASPTVENYLLPIITCSGYTGEKLYNHIRSRYTKYQKYLKSLAEELGIDYHLTSYVSRHTMAMTLQYNKIPREIISQMLGHADLETTNVYLDSFDNGVINEAAKVL